MKFERNKLILRERHAYLPSSMATFPSARVSKYFMDLLSVLKGAFPNYHYWQGRQHAVLASKRGWKARQETTCLGPLWIRKRQPVHRARWASWRGKLRTNVVKRLGNKTARSPVYSTYGRRGSAFSGYPITAGVFQYDDALLAGSAPAALLCRMPAATRRHALALPKNRPLTFSLWLGCFLRSKRESAGVS